MKFKNWNGKDINLPCLVSTKIDGVRVEYKQGKPYSRSGKPLYNLPEGLKGTYEVALEDWNATVSVVRSQQKLPTVSLDDMYMLHPKLDRRLLLAKFDRLAAEDVLKIAQAVWDAGEEGLIIHTNDGVRHKVKQKHTVDLPIIGIIPGKGKHKGRMGAILTEMGKVGTGFTDEDRERIDESYIGKIVECSYMELTKDGKLRMPVFERIREDKE